MLCFPFVLLFLAGSSWGSKSVSSSSSSNNSSSRPDAPILKNTTQTQQKKRSIQKVEDKSNTNEPIQSRGDLASNFKDVSTSESEKTNKSESNKPSENLESNQKVRQVETPVLHQQVEAPVLHSSMSSDDSSGASNLPEDPQESSPENAESFIWSNMAHHVMPTALNIIFHFNSNKLLELRFEKGEFFVNLYLEFKLDKSFSDLWNEVVGLLYEYPQYFELVNAHARKIWDEAKIHGKSFEEDPEGLLEAAVGKEKLLKKLFVHYFITLDLNTQQQDLNDRCKDLCEYVRKTYEPLLEQEAFLEEETKKDENDKDKHEEQPVVEQQPITATFEELSGIVEASAEDKITTDSNDDEKLIERPHRVLEFSIKTPDVAFLQIIEERYLVFDTIGEENLVIVDTKDYFDAVPFDESSTLSQMTVLDDSENVEVSKEKKSDGSTTNVSPLSGLEKVIAERQIVEVSMMSESGLDETIINVKDYEEFVNMPMIFAIGSAMLAMLIFLSLTLKFTWNDSPDQPIPEFAAK